MYKMKFINNKWNPTFSRNTQSSCSFPLSLWELCACEQGQADTGSWRKVTLSMEISELHALDLHYFFSSKKPAFLSTASCLDLNTFSLSPVSFLHAPNTCITRVSNESRSLWRHRAFHAQVATSCPFQKRNTATHAIPYIWIFIQTKNKTWTLRVGEKKLLRFMRIHRMYYKKFPKWGTQVLFP